MLLLLETIEVHHPNAAALLLLLITIVIISGRLDVVRRLARVDDGTRLGHIFTASENPTLSLSLDLELGAISICH